MKRSQFIALLGGAGFHELTRFVDGWQTIKSRQGAFFGTVGLDWQFAGIGPVHGAGDSDLVLRNVNIGQFEVYDIANNQLTGAAPLGAVGLDWQLGGFAANSPTGAMGSSQRTPRLPRRSVPTHHSRRC